MAVVADREKYKTLSQRLQRIEEKAEKCRFLAEEPDVLDYFVRFPEVQERILIEEPHHRYLLLLPIALGQGDRLYGDGSDWKRDKVDKLIEMLDGVDRVYAPIGGVAGYHAAFLDLLDDEGKSQVETIAPPPVIDLGDGADKMPGAVRKGLESLEISGEIYPVGGAGDRLKLYDSESGVPLPAALLPFTGKTLLELLIRDLQAREYLHYKLSGRQVTVPIAMMTSYEKDNSSRINSLMEDNSWFGRGCASYRLFIQPLVPMMTAEGEWAVEVPLEPMLKPGGHGVIWRCAIEAGVFDWFKNQGRTKAVVRQINNPFAAIDGGLLAFAGIGSSEDKHFGVATCPRRVGAAEGMDVLLLGRAGEDYSCCITNIEYTDFKKRGIEDTPAVAGGLYSRFPANTNILFVDLKAIEDALLRSPIPGLILNLKNKVKIRSGGGLKEVVAGRLESTMQNIADQIVDLFDRPCDPEKMPPLKSFLTYNRRSKTMSTTKKEYKKGEPLLETPQGCFYELQATLRDLLVDHCRMKVPPLVDEQEYLEKGPSFYFLVAPALGPLWSVIAQKVHGGSLANGAELQLEIAELVYRNVSLDGSLLIEAVEPVGERSAEGIVRYSSRAGKCVLEDVTVRNKGVDRRSSQDWWKNNLIREEALHIVIYGDGEFYASGVNFSGDERIEVPSGFRITAFNEGSKVAYRKEPIESPSWYWQYSYDDNDNIVLSR